MSLLTSFWCAQAMSCVYASESWQSALCAWLIGLTANTRGIQNIPFPRHTSHSRVDYFANILSLRHQAFQAWSYRTTEDISLRQDSRLLQCLINWSFNLAMRVSLTVLGGKNEAVIHWTTFTWVQKTPGSGVQSTISSLESQAQLFSSHSKVPKEFTWLSFLSINRA